MSRDRHREAMTEALRMAENTWRNDPPTRESYRERGLDRFDLMVDLAARVTGITKLMVSNDRLVADNGELRERIDQLEKGLGLVGELADQIADLVADPEGVGSV